MIYIINYRHGKTGKRLALSREEADAIAKKLEEEGCENIIIEAKKI